MRSLEADMVAIAKMLSEHIGPDLRERAEKALDEYLSGDDLRHLAVLHLVDKARWFARQRTLEFERTATTTFLRSKYPKMLAQEVEHWEEMTDRERSVAVLDAEWRQGEAQLHEGRREGHVGAYKPGSPSPHNLCDSCAACRHARRAIDKVNDKRNREMRKAFDAYELQLRSQLWTEWTADLLTAEIAMPDGTRTTWGDATIDQHRERREMLAKNSMANAESAARHAQAIEQLEESGAANLRALSMAAAERVA